MSYLTQGGTISYNGYTLQGPRNSVQLEVVPARDDTGRYVTHSVYRLAVDAWITSDTAGVTGTGADTATHMTQIRGALQQDGGALTITGFGLGDITCNTGSTDRDVAWGPKTQLLKMRNVGNGCIVLLWIVEVAIKTCAAGSLSGVLGRIKEYVYSVRYTIKRNGCTVRTVQGHLDIFLAPTTVGGRTISQTVDNYRDLVDIPRVDGFYRSQPQEYAVTKGNTRLEFRVTDEEPESDNIFPPGVADMDMDHTVTSDLFGQGGGFAVHFAQFTGHIEMARPFPISMAWEKGLLLMQERLVHAVNSGATPLIDYLSITEAMFERKISFTVRYRMLSSSLNKFVTNSGLFTDVTSTNIRSYGKSMQIAWANRGAARLMHNPTSELLADSCSPNQKMQITDIIAPYFLAGSSGSLHLVCPPESDSYLAYENRIQLSSDDDAITLQQMPTRPTSNLTTTSDFKGFAVQEGNGVRKNRKTVQSTGPGGIQIITVRGRSCRIGFKPEVPSLIKVMGQKAEFVSSGSTQEVSQVGFYGDCPIWVATWDFKYRVEFDSVSQMSAAIAGGLGDAIYKTSSGSDGKKKLPSH